MGIAANSFAWFLKAKASNINDDDKRTQFLLNNLPQAYPERSSLFLATKAKDLAENGDTTVKNEASEHALNHLPEAYPDRGSLFLATKAAEIAENRDKQTTDNSVFDSIIDKPITEYEFQF